MKTSLLTLLVLIHLGSFATIHTVKQDSTGNYTKIQDAIDAAQTGDTVLIWPGTYYENIDFIGKSITVGSLMITTGDESYKFNTIIDGNHNGSCVLVKSGEQTAVIFGLTIQNGSGFAFDGEPRTSGGGIFLFDSNLLVCNCIIKDNYSSSWGGGVACGGYLVIQSTNIFNNYTYGAGGGVAIGVGFQAVFDSIYRCNIYNNFAELGCDFSSANSEIPIYLYLDTCTVLNPDTYFAIMMDNQLPVDDLHIDVNHGLIEPWDGDLFVNPVTGDNNNSGTSPEDPLQSIAWAYSKIAVNEDHRNTIHLANGFYSDSVSNQIFPLNIRPNIDVVGESREGVILDGEFKTVIAKGNRTVSNFSFANMTMQRAGYVNYTMGFQNSNPFIYCYLETKNLAFENILFKHGWISPSEAAVKLNGSENVQIANCDFVGNYGDRALRIDLWNGNDTAWVTNCKFIENTVDYEQPEKRYGGGINPSGGTIIISNTLFQGNNKNAVAAFYEGNNYFVNCTFVNNSLDNPSVAIGAYDSKIYMYNCIEYNNGDYPLRVTNMEEQNESLLAIYNSLVEGGEESIDLFNEEWSELIYDTTNIEGDPLFLGGNYNPYNLSENSPCIDAGTLELPSFIEIPEFDLAGNPRVTNGKIDMGAYEWNPTVSNPEVYARKQNDSVTISPNPAGEYLHIYLYRDNQQEFKNAKGIFMDMQGNILKEIDMNHSDKTYILPVLGYPFGTYLFIYDNGLGLIKSKKVIIGR